jgi:hypothetical protein
MLETKTLHVTTQVACKKKNTQNHPKPPKHPKSKSPKKNQKFGVTC